MMFFPSLVMQAEELKMATQLSGPVMPIRNVSEALNQVLCVREFRLGFRGEDSCHSYRLLASDSSPPGCTNKSPTGPALPSFIF